MKNVIYHRPALENLLGIAKQFRQSLKAAMVIGKTDYYQARKVPVAGLSFSWYF